MIESVQVFDDMSDQAKFTKIDDGSRQKALNIKLKKDKRTSMEEPPLVMEQITVMPEPFLLTASTAMNASPLLADPIT